MVMLKADGLSRTLMDPPGQVIAHHVNKHGGKHQKYGHPKKPASMRSFPIGSIVGRMERSGCGDFVLAGMWLRRAQRLTAFSNRSRIAPGLEPLVSGCGHFQFLISGMSWPCLAM
jgi:hypothetical protein